jgi:hypothetical protein
LEEQKCKLSKELYSKTVKWINNIRYNQEDSKFLNQETADNFDMSIESHMIGEVVIVKNNNIKIEINENKDSKPETQRQVKTILEDIRNSLLESNRSEKVKVMQNMTYSQVKYLF